ncbi:MAG: protein kinase [Sandaracinaceae bacterium]
MSEAALSTETGPAKRLGRYELVHELGHGGMAHVYLARTSGPAGFQKWFAIKRIYERMARDRDFVDMFLDEARLAASLQHPNVVQTIELGQEDDQYFIAMEYLHGEPLSVVARRHQEKHGPLDPALAAFVCAEAAEGLHHAHEAADADGDSLELVHRDVSPHNIFVTYEGRVVLTDFGVAKARGRVTQTETGMVKGKIAYSAPEQLRGEAMDRRVDVFALGVVLFELTTGRRLFKAASDAETLQRIYSGHRVAPTSLVPDYPNELEDIIERALAHDAGERTPTALEMARALRAFASGSGIDASELKRQMGALFEDEITEKSAILRRRASLEVSAPAPVAPTEEEPSRSHTRATMPPREASDRGRWVLLLALVAVGLTALGWTLASRTSSGVVRIDSDPPGAAVFVDGQARGRTPALLETVPEGQHEVRLEQDGFEPFEAPFRLSGDRVELSYAMRRADPDDETEIAAPVEPESAETQPAQPELAETQPAPPEPAPREPTEPRAGTPSSLPSGDARRPPRRATPDATGQLSLVTDPWARVWVNGRDAGYTPLVGFEVPAGRVRVRLQAEGEGAFVTRTYRVGAGETAQHRESL